MQSRRHSAAETVANLIVGFGMHELVRRAASRSLVLKRRAPTSRVALAGAPREGTSGVLVLWGGFDGSFATMTRHLYACIDEV